MGRYQEGAIDMGTGYATGKSPQIAVARLHHRNMARDQVAGGLTPGQMARLYGFSPCQISVIMGSPAYLAEVKRLENMSDLVAIDSRDEIRVMSQLAMENLKDDLLVGTNKTTGLREDIDTPSRRVRQNASLEVLGLAGIRKKDQPISTINVEDNRTVIQINAMSDDELRNEVFEDLIEVGDD